MHLYDFTLVPMATRSPGGHEREIAHEHARRARRARTSRRDCSWFMYIYRPVIAAALMADGT